MSKMSSIKSVMLALFLVFCAGAFGMPWASLGAKRKITTIVISGNFKSPRLLAELIMLESRQPYILLPATEEDGRIIFCPCKGNAMQIPQERFNEFIRIANPERIVVLGDERYVPNKYVDMLDQTIPIIRVTGNNWDRIADELTFMLNLSNLKKHYRKLRAQLLSDGSIYRPVSRPAPKEEAQPDVANADIATQEEVKEEATQQPKTEEVPNAK